MFRRKDSGCLCLASSSRDTRASFHRRRRSGGSGGGGGFWYNCVGVGVCVGGYILVGVGVGVGGPLLDVGLLLGSLPRQVPPTDHTV